MRQTIHQTNCDNQYKQTKCEGFALFWIKYDGGRRKITVTKTKTQDKDKDEDTRTKTHETRRKTQDKDT